nr:MAG TPA: hypothetical protein [Bacteriophage sp.]
MPLNFMIDLSSSQQQFKISGLSPFQRIVTC